MPKRILNTGWLFSNWRFVTDQISQGRILRVRYCYVPNLQDPAFAFKPYVMLTTECSRMKDLSMRQPVLLLWCYIHPEGYATRLAFCLDRGSAVDAAPWWFGDGMCFDLCPILGPYLSFFSFRFWMRQCDFFFSCLNHYLTWSPLATWFSLVLFRWLTVDRGQVVGFAP